MLAAGCLLAGCAAPAGTRDADREKTAFQTGRPWKDVTDNRADVAIIYDTNDAPGMSFEERVESWRSKGYKTHFMTGIAWGSYQDYFTGEWDGVNHLDEGQVVPGGGYALARAHGALSRADGVVYRLHAAGAYPSGDRRPGSMRSISKNLNSGPERVTARRSSANGRSITVSTGVPSTNRRKTPTFRTS